MLIVAPRGCTNSPFKVATDSQWEAFKAALANTPKSVSDVKVNVNWKQMKKWKPRDDESVCSFISSQHILLISYQDDELDEGTQVSFCKQMHISEPIPL